jgi:toxin ParE1/3/4
VRVIWSPTALRQVSRIYTYLAEFNPQAARDIAQRLLEAGESLASFPHRGRRVRGTGLREWPIVKPYIIRYRIAGEVVRILQVRHGRQRR